MLTTYNVLRSEVHFTQQQRRLREPKKYRSLPTPLTLVKWWRVCLGTSLSLSLIMLEIVIRESLSDSLTM